MLRKKRYFIFPIPLCIILSVILIGAVSLGAESVKFPDTPAGKSAKEIINLLNNGTPPKIQQYIYKNYSTDFLQKVPVTHLVQIFCETQDTYKGFEIKGIDKSSEFELFAVLWAPVTETWTVFRIKLEDKAPHKIFTFQLRPVPPPAGKAPAKKMTDKQIADTLKTYLGKLVEKDIFSGTVLIAKDEKIIFKGAYGLASKRFNVSNRIDTKFNLGSMNKMFTAVAIAQLVEKRKLNYDDTVGKYLDATWVHKETAEKVKIKHLLTHTSGLGSYFNEEFAKSSKLLYRNLVDYKSLIKNDKPRFEPGSNWLFSNTGMFLLGAIIQKVAKTDYFQYIRENIYEPAGMINSDCFEMDRPVPNLAIGYFKKFDGKGFYWRNNIFNYMLKGGPAAGGFSTVEDLLEFVQALRNNKLISRKSLELLTTSKPELKSPQYGYGFTVIKKDDELIIGHSGGFPGIRSILHIFMKSGYTYVILSNYSSGMTPVKEKIESLISLK